MRYKGKYARKPDIKAVPVRSKRFVHLTALLLCLLMVFSSVSPIAFAAQGDEFPGGEGSTVVNQEEPSEPTNGSVRSGGGTENREEELDLTEPDCTCGSEDENILNHADDCAKKIWYNQKTDVPANSDGENTVPENPDLTEPDCTCGSEDENILNHADDCAKKIWYNQKTDVPANSDGENTVPENPDLTEPDCTCGNEEADVIAHADDCARKNWWKQLAEEQDAQTIASLWTLFPEDAQEYILTYLSWTNLDKYKELEKLVNGSEELPAPVEIDGVSISVTGDGLEGLSLSTENGATEQAKKSYLENEIVELTDEERAEGSFFSFDLSLQDQEGSTVQPENSVRVTLNIGAGAEDEVVIYHLLDDAAAISSASGEVSSYTAGGLSSAFAKECEAAGSGDTVYYEVLTTWNGGLTNNGDGTVSFDTASFSYYWTWNSKNRTFERVYNAGGSRIWVGRQDGKTLYIPYSEQDQVIKFRSSNSPAGNGYEIISGSDYATLEQSKSNSDVTIKGGTPEGAEIKVKYTHGALTGASDTVTLKVVRIPKEFIKDLTDIPVSIAIMWDNSRILSEPTKTEDAAYVRVASDLSISQDKNTKYASNAYDLIDKSILDRADFIQNANGDYVWGMVDATGRSTLPMLNLTKAQQETIITNYINGIKAQVSTYNANPEDMRLLPYVIKVEMEDGSTKPGKGAAWFVDCIIVRKDEYSISYQANLEYGYEIKSGTLPDGSVVKEGSSVTVGNTDIVAQKASDSGSSTHTATFKYWRDQDGNRYYPGDTITDIQQDYILYAVWNYPDQTLGNLHIGKTVVNEAIEGEPNADQQFTFQVSLNGQSGAYRYSVFDSIGNVKSQGTVSDGGTISLKAGQYAVIYDLPQNTNYSVTETDIPDGYLPEVTTRTGTIIAGDMMFANFTNDWIGETATLAVTKTIPTDTTGDRTKMFTFTIKNNFLAGRNVAGLTFDENGVASFQLKHSQTVTLKGLPIGQDYLITETDAEGYTVSYKIGESESQNGNAVTVTLGESGETVEFINSQNIIPPTGLDLGNVGRIYGLIFGAVFMLAAGSYVMISRRCKKRKGIQ